MSLHILNPGLTEIRFMGKRERFGLFTADPELIAEAYAQPCVRDLDGYQLLNPPKDDTPERKRVPRDTLFRARKNQLAGDADVARRRLILFDSDSVKPTGAAATEAQRAAALAHSAALEAALTAEGWPAPVVCDSGNGAHRLYAVDLPNDRETDFLIANLLHLAARKFDTEAVKIDKSVGNPSRITRLYGARNHKAGRDSAVISLGDARVVTAEQIRELVTKWRGSLGYKRTLQQRPGGWTPERVESFLDFYSIDYRPPVAAVGEGLLWVLAPCPLNSAHTGSSPAVYLSKNGWPKFRCQHDSCAPFLKWDAFRKKLYHITKRWFLDVA